MPRFRSKKTYCHELGLSACFRQWRADSHCRFLHGYALEIGITFEGPLDERNWVFDFGGLKPIKDWLVATFDHKTLVALDDPDYSTFENLASQGLIQMTPCPDTGCEAFSLMIASHIREWLMKSSRDPGLLYSVEVREHGANGAMVIL